MQAPILIALTIGLGIVALAVIFLRRNMESPGDTPPDQPVGKEPTEGPVPVFDPETVKKFNIPPSFASAKSPEEARRIRLLILLGVSMIPLLVIIGLVKKISEDGGLSSADAAMFPFVPIWIAIFVPLFAARKKKTPGSEDERNAGLAVAIGIMVAVLLAGVAVAFFLIRQGA